MKYISCFLSILITIILMLRYTVLIEFQTTTFYTDSTSVWLVVKMLCFLQMGYTVYHGYLWRKARVSVTPLYKDPQAIQIMVVIFVSILGTFYEPYLFTIHFLEIFSMIDVLKDIFAAIAVSIKEIAIVSMMGVAFMFIFCLISFSNYMKDVYKEDESVDEMCNSVSSCILDLYVSGVIGETTGKFDFVRFAYDMVYMVFFGLLFGNIISGIMLGAFGTLREKKEALDEDKSNNCYICNMNRDDI